jgi:hypothetical protein
MIMTKKTKLVIGPFGVHYAKIVDENGKYIKWATDEQILYELSRETWTLNRRGSTIDLKIPFTDKNNAKKLGARWDDFNKCWYVCLDNTNIDYMIHNTSWITEDAILYCANNQDTPKVETNKALERYMKHRVQQGWDNRINWSRIETAIRDTPFYEQI